MEKRLKNLIGDCLKTVSSYVRTCNEVTQTITSAASLAIDIAKYAKDCDEAAGLRDALTTSEALKEELVNVGVEASGAVKDFTQSFETEKTAREKAEKAEAEKTETDEDK